jgi:uncharacterized membrane protein YczE
MAYGVSFSIQAGLGTSPISSLPYVIGLFTPLTVGTATIAMHCVLIALQIIILRRNYHPIQLLQLPVGILFGLFTDLTLASIQSIVPATYLQQWICCLVGIALVALGVSMEVAANVIVLAGEGFSLAVCAVAPIRFGNMKVVFDVTLVCLAILFSFLGLGHLAGVREGTVAAALLVGQLVKLCNKVYRKLGLVSAS